MLLLLGLVLVLAYLTNPSESSFRTYLTQLSFRLHLHTLHHHPTPDIHFANRATISLRTPKHVFHSFAIFTIAAIVPTHPDPSIISDSWFVGAFGNWWPGGFIRTWYHHLIDDEENSTEGISIKASGDLHTPTLPHREPPSPLPLPQRSSPPPPPPQSPLIAQVLRQISNSTGTVHDLRTQLSDFQSSSSQSHALLQSELDSHRDRKRREDVSRLDLKSRTKSLEDTRRNAESAKAKVDKRLKTAQGKREDLTQANAQLDDKARALEEQLEEDREARRKEKEDTKKAEDELIEALERKRAEIKEAEALLTTLGARARELEELLTTERERLRLARAQADETHIRSHTSSTGPLSPQPQKTFSNFISPGSSDIALRAKGYAIFDDDIASFTKSQTTPFSRSFQSDADPFVDRHWREAIIAHQRPTNLLTVSPSSDVPLNDYDPFKVRIPPKHHDRRMHSDPLVDVQQLTALHRTHSDPNPSGYEGYDVMQGEEASTQEGDGKVGSPPRRWFSASASTTKKKGLNPDAKVFRLSKKSTTPVLAPYDALNPNGALSIVPSTGTSTFLRAFAPSRAEREALQRALGGAVSTNASLERLPSLSDVRIPSPPSSPSPSHSVPAGVGTAPVTTTGLPLPAWLQSLPRIRKTKFSPWDDDEESPVAGDRGGV